MPKAADGEVQLTRRINVSGIEVDLQFAMGNGLEWMRLLGRIGGRSQKSVRSHQRAMAIGPYEDPTTTLADELDYLPISYDPHDL
jgi:hypothetical protein